MMTGVNDHNEMFERAISEAGAARATHDLMIEMVQAGFSTEKAKGIRYAFNEFLVGADGYKNCADEQLDAAGFSPAEREEIIGLMAEAPNEVQASVPIRPLI